MDHTDVADCAVFPMKDDIKGEVPVGLVVVNKGSTISEEQLRKDLILLVREKLGPVASFKKVGSVRALPKVRCYTSRLTVVWRCSRENMSCVCLQ
jgi:propionyl-CoA synthetase